MRLRWSRGLVTVLCCRDPWEMLYVLAALQPLCSGQMLREKERMSKRGSTSQTPACLTAFKSYVLLGEPPNDLLLRLKDFLGTWRFCSESKRGDRFCMLKFEDSGLSPSHGVHVLSASGQTGSCRKVSPGHMGLRVLLYSVLGWDRCIRFYHRFGIALLLQVWFHCLYINWNWLCAKKYAWYVRYVWFRVTAWMPCLFTYLNLLYFYKKTPNTFMWE